GMRRSAAMVLMSTVLLAPAAGHAADAGAGQAIFARCKICHSIESGGANIVGPNLHGVFGRKAGSLDAFAYSEAMKQSGIVWDDETLTKYVKSPKDVVPGGKMAFPGIKDDAQLADLLAYLHQAAQ